MANQFTQELLLRRIRELREALFSIANLDAEDYLLDAIEIANAAIDKDDYYT